MKYRVQRDADERADARGSGGVSAGKRTLTQSLARRATPEGSRDDNGVAADADVAVDRAAGGSGAPLRADVRDRFESSLGADLSGVRVHTGGASEEASSAVGARAYTVGNDIHFGAGQYQPDDPFGLHLLAHEVAHTQQQSGGPAHRQNKLEVSAPGDAAEVEADGAADAMVAGKPAAISGGRAAVARAGGPSYSRGERSDDERSGGAMTSAEFEQECEMKKLAAYLELGEIAHSLYEAAARAAVRKETGDAGSKEKKTLTQTIKELTSTGKQIAGLASAVNTIKGGSWGAQLESVKGGLAKAGDVIDAIEAVRAIRDTAPLEKLQKDPSEANAKEWALAVTDKFDAASRLVALLPIEVGFVKDYFEGVLGAPKAYVKVFLSIMTRRYDGIDAEADVSKSGRSYGSWEGPSSVLGIEADTEKNHDLYRYMLANMEIDGKNIEKCSYELARDLFASKIARDEGLTEQVRTRWLTHLGR